MDDHPSGEEIQALALRIGRWECSVEEMEEGLTWLRANVSYFRQSDFFLSTQDSVRLRYTYLQALDSMGEITQEVVLKLIDKILRCDGTSEDSQVWMEIIKRHVPNPEAAEYIDWPEEGMGAEQMVERLYTCAKPAPDT